MKNFLSIGNSFIEVDFTTNSRTLIIGNSGEGKSTLIDAISFALYGVPYRKIKKGQIVNSINKKNLVVEIEFDNYKVIRGISPNKFEIYKDDQLIEQSADVRTYQEYLEKEVLKRNHKTFIQTIVLGSAAFTPFMQLTPADRRKVVEDVLDSHIYSKMAVLAKFEFDSLKKRREELKYKIDLIKDSITSFSEVLSQQTAASDQELKEIDEILKRKKEEYSQFVNDIQDETTRLDVLKEKTDNYNYTLSEITKACQIYYDKARSIENEIKFLQKDLAFITDNGSCSLCKQDITHEHKENTKSTLDENISTLNEKLEAAKNKHSSLEEKRDELSDHLNEISSIETKLVIENNKLGAVEDSIKYMLSRKEDLKSRQKNDEYNIAKTKLDSLKSEISAYNVELQTVIDTQKAVKTCIDILKDDGIKSVVVSKYIPTLNKYINKYLEQLDMFVSFELDSEFNESIKSRFRDEFSYYSFSEGEKKRIDLSILLAFRDITALKSNSHSNLLIIDELMDNLDRTNVDNIENILKTYDNTNLVIISHSDDIKNRELFNRVIQAKKVNNFTEYEVI